MFKIRGMMVSFGNASGPIEPCNVTKSLAPKGLYLTRPSIAHYTTTKKSSMKLQKKFLKCLLPKSSN
jgi:NADPH2:quinone reductase